MFSIKTFIVLAGAFAVSGLSCAVFSSPIQAQEGEPQKDFIEVKMVGTLNAEVFAIGGETTGVVISAQGITWELDFGKKANLRKLAQELHGTKVRVQGELKIKKGVEIQQRWILTVDSLRSAKSEKSK